jgi:hypothetical protein
VNRALLPALLVLALSGCPGTKDDHFQLSGTVMAAPNLQRRTEQHNTVLFVVASNGAGVPIAVKRFIDPKLPLHYQMKSEDLLLPGPVWKGDLTVKVFVNSHGKAGVVEPGDLTGTYKFPVRSGERHVNLLIDTQR